MITTQDIRQEGSRKAGEPRGLGSMVTRARGHLGACRELLDVSEDLAMLGGNYGES